MPRTRPSFVLFTAVITIFLLASPVARADEGMWLFNNPPQKLLKEKYDFVPTDEWLAHLQRSAVRFNNGGSGSFVSADGLVMTNHHVGADALQKLSTQGARSVAHRASTPAPRPRSLSAPTGIATC